MKRFNLGLIIVVIASKWWLLVPVLALIAGVLAFLKQLGSPFIAWSYVFVCSFWGGGIGVVYLASEVEGRKGVAAPLLSGLVVVMLAIATGLMLSWEPARTLTVSLVGFGFGLIAPRWISHLNLG